MTPIIKVFLVVSLVIGLLYVLWKPRWAIVLVWFMLPLEQLLAASSPLFVSQGWILNVAIGGVGLLAFVSACVRPGSRIRESLNPASLAIFALYMVATAGLLWTPARAEALGYMKTGLPYYALFLVIAPALLDDLEDFRRLLFPLMLVGGLIALLILIHPDAYFYAGRLCLPVGHHERGDGAGNPLELGRLGGNVAIVAMLLRPPRTATLLMVLRVAAFLVGFGLAIGSGSRGQVIAAMGAGVLFIPIARRLDDPKRFFLTAIGGLVAILGCYMAFKLFVDSTNQARWSMTLMLDDLGGRFDFAWSLISVYLTSPGSWLFGLGPNAFTAVSQYGSAYYVHNLAVEVFCEEGLVGFAMLTIACLFAWSSGLSVWRAYRNEPSYRAAIAILGALVAYNLLLALKQSSFLAAPTFFMYLLVLAKVSVGEVALISSGEVEPVSELEEEEESEDDFNYDEHSDDAGYDIDYGAGDMQPSPG